MGETKKLQRGSRKDVHELDDKHKDICTVSKLKVYLKNDGFYR